MKILTLLGLALLATLSFYGTPTEACSCMQNHPQTHYCKADYVALVRVLRKTVKLVAHRVVYKVEVKKSYKMNKAGQRTLQHGRIVTADSDSMCGVNLEIGRLYVIAGQSAELSLCHYAKEYQKMTMIERMGFTGAYRRGCKCAITTCFGDRCRDNNQQRHECKWSYFDKCARDHSACFPVINRSHPEPVIKCRWKKTVPYDVCMEDPAEP